MIGEILSFIKQAFTKTGKETAIIAVSGGIDSAVSLSLVVRALGAEKVHVVLLPYGEQDMTDARAVVDFNQIPTSNQHEIQIKPIVDQLVKSLQTVGESNKFRLGNIMARTRMIVVYDLAKSLDGLVCGTENKSEKYLGYFTRFGDEASDLEPIQHLFKTQVRQVATELQLPQVILTKQPSAGLWQDQTDEVEFGFSYDDADKVLEIIVDKQPALLERLTNGKARSLEEVRDGARFLSGASLDPTTIEKVLKHVQANWFKHQVPYHMESELNSVFK
jgi:NAD+ synthase